MILDTYTKEELISTLEFGYWPFGNASGLKIYGTRKFGRSL